MESKFNGKCVELNEFGQGVVYFDNSKVIVDNLLEGEEASIIITKKCKSYYLGRVHCYLTKSKERVDFKCSKRCGGCNLLHLDYQKQVEFKFNLMKQLFNDYPVGSFIKADDNLHYRNKVIYALDNSNSNIIYGLYEEATHKVIKNYCHTNNPLADELAKTIVSFLKEKEIYDVGYLLMRFTSLNECLVGIVCQNREVDFTPLIPLLKDKVNSIIINYNDFKTNVVLTSDNKIIYGENKIKEKLGDYYYYISLNSFFQVNHSQCLKLYNLVKSKLPNIPNLTLLDAYSGTGTIGIYLSDKASKCYEVEVNKAAHENAIENLKLNNLTNIYCYNADCQDFMKDTKINFDLVVMDPPRSGLSTSFVKSTLESGIANLIYISCNPKSLKRDLELLKTKYDVISIDFIDMFPNTLHVECIVVLEQK